MAGLGDGKTTMGGSSSSAFQLEDHFGEGIMPPCDVSVAGGVDVQCSEVQHLDLPNNLVPLTVKQLTLLTPSTQYGSALSLHGMPVTTGRFVGVMRNRRDLDSEIIFDFDDGTGRVKARIWTVESQFMRSLDTAKDGDYIVLNGGIRGGTHDMHIRVYSVRIVTNYNDITHHFLSCIYVHLDLRKQARLRQADRDRREDASVVPEHCISVHSTANSLFDSVLRAFYRPGIIELENGASFSLIRSVTGADEDQLRAVIGAHVAIGNLFTTIDEDHFKCSFNG